MYACYPRAEGGGRDTIKNKFKTAYLPTLKANYMIWPAVQIINFKFMPLQFQIVSNIAGVMFGLRY